MEHRGSETFCVPPSRQGKTFCNYLLKSGNFERPPPLQYGLNFKLLHKNYPKTVCAPPPPLAWLKLFPPPPPFCRGKTSRVPPPTVLYAPLPVISDQPLILVMIKAQQILQVYALRRSDSLTAQDKRIP